MGAGRPTATAPQTGAAARHSAANAGNAMTTAELTRLNTDFAAESEPHRTRLSR